MFIPAIERLATDEQKSKWLPLALSYQIIGTYAQTELGHGMIDSDSLDEIVDGNWVAFYTLSHESGQILWFHVRCLCICPSICISFPDDNLNKYQWIFTKHGVCIDIIEIWFLIANGQISSILDRVICLPHIHMFMSRW